MAEVTFKIDQGIIIDAIMSKLRVSLDTRRRGTHIALIVPDEMVEVVEKLKAVYEQPGVVVTCDALDCPCGATWKARLAKSGQTVLLCGSHATRFATRGLISFTKAAVPMIDMQEIV